jgi:phosphatidylserine/phosphatidylglycerophosphate/cardiolipin synthase-like enzyme
MAALKIKRAVVAIVVLLAIVGGRARGQARLTPVDVRFSPKGGCLNAILDEIGEAKRSVHVLACSFTSAPIAKALVDAKARGVLIEVVIDRKRIRHLEAKFLTNQGIPIWADGKHAIAHNSVMVIDGKVVITGSLDLTKVAEESNAENVLILRLPDIAAKCEKNYQDHLAHSAKYAGKLVDEPPPLAEGQPVPNGQHLPKLETAKQWEVAPRGAWYDIKGRTYYKPTEEEEKVEYMDRVAPHRDPTINWTIDEKSGAVVPDHALIKAKLLKAQLRETELRNKKLEHDLAHPPEKSDAGGKKKRESGQGEGQTSE